MVTHFLFLMLFGQQLLGDDLAGEDLFRVHLGQLVASSEATFAEKFALHIAIAGGGVDDDIRYGNVLLAARLR